jgi:membrane protein implicated in regulation of membrane protease activity
MRAELVSIRAAGADAVTAEPSVAESALLPEFALVLLVTGLTVVLARVANWAGVGTVLVGVGLLASGCVVVALARPTPGVLVLLGLAGIAVALEVLAYAGRGLYAATVVVCVLVAGLELSGWPAGARAGLIVTIGCVAGVVTLVASSRSWNRTRDLPFDRSRGLLGRGAIVLRDGSSTPRAVVCGELWPLRAKGGELHDGERVRVAGVHDGTLIVEHARAR